jgi:hypothetical protein
VGFLKKGREVIQLNRQFAFCLASGIAVFTLTFAGCQKKDEPVPVANPAPAAAPAGNASTGGGAVATGPTGSDVSPGSSAATGETKTPEKQEPGKKTF